jgi:epoxyqueuosine reductase
MKEFFSKELLSKWKIVDYSTTSESVPESLAHYNEWVVKKQHLPLEYLEGERQAKRQNVKTHWPDFQSAIVFLFSYHDTHQSLQHFYADDNNWNGLKIASYTMGFVGEDYHHLLKERLSEIGEYLKTQDESLEYKLTLDTHPVLERDLAYRAGLGWFGKNSMLINRHHGSFFIIGSLLLNKQIESKSSVIETDHCGQCSSCVDSCPTKAIDPETRTITAKDCISTFTIEQFKLDSLPSEKMDLTSGWIFGCDICQDVCPWNKRIDRKNGPVASLGLGQEKIVNFFLRENKTDLIKKLEAMSEGEFRRQLKGTSFERSGRRGLLKNLRLHLKQLNIFS